MGKRKYVIEFSEHLDNLLEILAREKNTTKAEIIRRALAAYVYMNEECKAGSHIYVINEKANARRELIFITDEEGVANRVIYQFRNEDPAEYFRRAIMISRNERQSLWIVIGFHFVKVYWHTKQKDLLDLLEKYSTDYLKMEE